MREPKRPKEEVQSVPGWIVSFSDMVTLLLAFFVLLQTFAKTQDPELFYAGQGSFRRAVSGFGISSMFSGEIEAPIKDWRKIKYPTAHKTLDPGSQRVIDSDDEEIRMAFREIRRKADVQASAMNEETISVFSTDIIFAPGDVSLNAEATRYLKALAADLERTVDPAKTKLYVVGLAADEKDSKSQWTLSARRAKAVHKALERLLLGGDSERGWKLFSWGAGPGGRWCRKRGIVARTGRETDKSDLGGTHVVISVVRERG